MHISDAFLIYSLQKYGQAQSNVKFQHLLQINKLTKSFPGYADGKF